MARIGSRPGACGPCRGPPASAAARTPPRTGRRTRSAGCAAGSPRTTRPSPEPLMDDRVVHDVGEPDRGNRQRAGRGGAERHPLRDALGRGIDVRGERPQRLAGRGAHHLPGSRGSRRTEHVLVPSTLVVTVWCTWVSASPGSRWEATWKIRSGLISPISASIRAWSLTSAYRYSAPGCRGQSRVTPRVTLTILAGLNAASCVIKVDPTQPVPPVTRTTAPSRRSASRSLGRQSSRLITDRKRSYSVLASSRRPATRRAVSSLAG